MDNVSTKNMHSAIDVPNRYDCPGCGLEAKFSGALSTGQPVMMHSLCATKEDAINLGKGAIRLKECENCGLIFNSAFDPSLINYSDTYDNRQGFSATFRSHLESLADRLLSDLPESSAILEVGCGKGEFLRILRDRGAKCVGYDTSCPMPGERGNEEITYHRSYVNPGDINQPYDIIICRHVVEHIPEIREFFKLLLELSRRTGNAMVAIETPAFEWIAENECFWDIFYEHCNYYQMPALASIAKAVGFKVVSHEAVFDGQYQLLRIIPDASAKVFSDQALPCLSSFFDKIRATKESLTAKIDEARVSGQWAIWGAGAKGVTLATHYSGHGLKCVVDSNPAKAGKWLPGSGIPIISPDAVDFQSISLVLVANSIYRQEIESLLISKNYQGKILNVEQRNL